MDRSVAQKWDDRSAFVCEYSDKASRFSQCKSLVNRRDGVWIVTLAFECEGTQHRDLDPVRTTALRLREFIGRIKNRQRRRRLLFGNQETCEGQLFELPAEGRRQIGIKIDAVRPSASQ